MERNSRALETRRRVTHSPNIGKSDASWDDYVHVTEMTTDTAHETAMQVTSIRTIGFRVTAEFMRDAGIDPLEFIDSIAADRLR